MKSWRRLGFRTKVLLLAVLASAPPWLLSLAASGSGLGPAIGLDILAGVTCTSAIWALVNTLRPIRTLVSLGAAEARIQSRANETDLDMVIGAFKDLRAELASLEHRSVQRHSVTGLPTREYLVDEIAKSGGDRDARLLGIVRFRDFDRLYAFDAGTADRALTVFAAQLTSAVGPQRPLAQIDRDSFGIWFWNSTPDVARMELDGICYALRKEITVGDLTLVPEVDAGAGVYPGDGDDPAALITRTLISLDGVVRTDDFDDRLAGPSANRAARERFSLEQDLYRAVSRDQLELYFQPVIDLRAGTLVAAEALIRWNHPTLGQISPTHFVPILEAAQLTDEVGLWALNTACRACRAWRGQGLESVTVAVNLSAAQLGNPSLVKAVERTLERHSLPPSALALELTETAAMQDMARTHALFSALRKLGIGLSIDDFGSGYSSLSYVKNLPFDKLKIDREFVVDVHQRPDNQAICKSLIALADGLGIRILAEGVEKVEEVDFLRESGCNLFQGFYFARPLSEDAFREFGHQWSRRQRFHHNDTACSPPPEHRMTA